MGHRPTVLDAIGDLPEEDEYDELLERDWVEAKFGKPSDYARALRQWPNSRGREILTSSLRTIHTAHHNGISKPPGMERLSQSVGSISSIRMVSATQSELGPQATGERLRLLARFILSRHGVSPYAKRRVCRTTCARQSRELGKLKSTKSTLA